MTSATLTTSPREAGRPVELVSGLAELAPRYDLVLSDVWGVLHDGVTAFPAAGDALRRFRAGGGRVVLVSNAPRPGFVVTRQLDGLGVPRDAYDDVVTSGDVTRALVSEHGTDRMFHLGPERDIRLFDGLPARSGSLEDADFVVCTGLFDDETETVEDYADTLARMRARNLLMICANPDIVVERGHLLLPCAGALAVAYEAIGGTTVTGGKPHAPIYDAALRAGATALGRAADRARVLAVGDAIRTDVTGARDYGLDALLVARGIHAADMGYSTSSFSSEQALNWLTSQPRSPTALAPELSWAALP